MSLDPGMPPVASRAHPLNQGSIDMDSVSESLPSVPIICHAGLWGPEVPEGVGSALFLFGRPHMP